MNMSSKEYEFVKMVLRNAPDTTVSEMAQLLRFKREYL